MSNAAQKEALEASAKGPKAVARVMRPRSVAIVGISSRAGSTGHIILAGLRANDFTGDIYLVGRSSDPIDGLPVLSSPLLLPEGVDLAVFTLPAAGVKEAVADCVKRKVGSAMIFAAGFAETGQNDVQEEVARTAREGGLAIVGPNCLGFTNNVDGMMLHMMFSAKANRWKAGDAQGIAVVGQSGGLLGHIQRSADSRGIPMTYVISTGNEAGLDLADYTEYMVEDAATKLIVLYAEQIRRPREFLAACERARAIKKPILLLHPGRGEMARAAAQSHTGSLVGDHGAMLTNVANAGVLIVDTLDELTDLAELLYRYPQPPIHGPAVLTASGAFVALINDFSETIDLQFAKLEAATMEKLRQALPAFGTPNNPLDVTAGVAPGGNVLMTKALLEDPNVGSLFISYPISGPKGLRAIQAFTEGMQGNKKPVIMVALGDQWALGAEIDAANKSGPYVSSRSSDRCLRAITHFTRYGRQLARERGDLHPAAFKSMPKLGKGTQPEWLGKQVLAAMGISVPAGGLATSVDEAAATAKRIGYPVAMKAQAAALSHKTEAGGVILNVQDEAALRAAWDTLQQNVARAAPGVKLDGALVETMAAKGLELMVGAKRDPAWGPVLLLGLGGIWVEALGDVRLVPANATEATVIEELQKLRTAKLLKGFRGAPAVDIEAVARTVTAIGRLMLTETSIVEVDINPLVALPRGKGVLALDALIVTE